MLKNPDEASTSDVGREQVSAENVVSSEVADIDNEYFISDEEVKASFRSRKTYKGKFTHACKELESALISYDNESLVLKQFVVATKAFDRLVASNDKALTFIDPESEEYHVQLNYIIPSKDDMLNMKERVDTWLTECRAFKQSKVKTSQKPQMSSAVPKHSGSHSSRSSRSSIKSVGQLKLEQLKTKQEYEEEMAKHQSAVADQQRAMRHLKEQRAVQEEIDRELLLEAEGKTESVKENAQDPRPSTSQETQVKYNAIQSQYTLGPCVTKPKYLLVSSAPSPQNVCVQADLMRAPDQSISFPPPPSDLNPNAQDYRRAVPKPEVRSQYEERGSDHDSMEWAAAFANYLRLGQELPKIENE